MSNSKFQTALLTLGSIAAIIIAGTQIYDWVTRPSDELVGIIDYGSFEFPKGVKDTVDSVIDLTHTEYKTSKTDLESRISKYIDEDHFEYISGSIDSHFTSYLRSSLPNELIGSYGRFRGYWNAKIVNEGTTTLKEVTVSLPDTVYVQVSREGSEIESGPQNSVIRLDSMLPQEVIKVYAWTTSNISYFDVDELKLVHAAGAGSLIVQSKVGPFWVWLDRYWGLILFLLSSLYLLFLWTVPQIKKDIAKHKNDQSSE